MSENGNGDSFAQSGKNAEERGELHICMAILQFGDIALFRDDKYKYAYMPT